MGYGNPITLARRVMEHLPHVLVVGRGAERFAAELGMQPAEQLTEAALARWRERFVEHGLTPGASEDLAALARSEHTSYCPYKGDASYYSIPAGGERSRNAVWTYEAPFEAMAQIKDAGIERLGMVTEPAAPEKEGKKGKPKRG